MPKKPPHILREAECLAGNEVRLFFASGKILETTLPVRSCRRLRVVDCGLGLDPGDGKEFAAVDLYRRRGKEMWIGRRRKRKRS